jgi:ABC-type amino acid transport substrate-binding protein
MKHRSRLVAAISAMVTILAACSGTTSSTSSTSSSATSKATAGFNLVTPGYLTVAVYGTGPPDVILSPNGKQFSGVDGELIEGFAKSVGLKVKIFETTFASSILAVEQHKADIGTYIYYTAERASGVYYTLPFMNDVSVLFTLKSFPYTGISSLKGKAIGTVVGFVWAPYLQKAIGSLAHLYPDQVTVGTALLNGTIQGYVNGSTTVLVPPMNTPNVVPHALAPGDFGFPESLINTTAYNDVNCKNTALATAFDNYELSLSNSGKYAPMVNSVIAQVEAQYHATLPAQGLVPTMTVQ